MLNLKEAKDIFRTYLKENQHRITSERFEIMKYALEYEGHFGADDLYLNMKQKNSDVSRATVYNTLELLVDCGLLYKRQFGDNINRYERAFHRREHDHLICKDCGKILEFTHPQIESILKELSIKLGVEISSYSFNVYGKCNNSHNCEKVKNYDSTKSDSR